jgi:hypothetical protein
MTTIGKSWTRISVIILAVAALLAETAAADPVRITVHFTVAGATGSNGIRDPDFGNTSASGLFSLITAIPPGDGFRAVQNLQTGLGADKFSLSFANTSWTTANADVGFLIFFGGRLTHWFVGAVPELCCVSQGPLPDIGIDDMAINSSPGSFHYTTRRSEELGVFSGTVSTTSINTTPVAPTPEPTSLVLWVSGLACIGARGRQRRCRARGE